MTIQISAPLRNTSHGNSRFSVSSIGLYSEDTAQSSILALDDFRVNGHQFPPHPHAGFSAVTYVFEDTQSGLRSCDSLGNDIRVGPGGIVWTQAGRGAIHHEMQSQANAELHGVQFFVNLSAGKKLIPPQVFWCDGDRAPIWSSAQGDRVRVVVGDYEGLHGPVEPEEPFTLLDAAVVSSVRLNSLEDHLGILYVYEGRVALLADTQNVLVGKPTAVAIKGQGKVRIQTSTPAKFLFLSAPLLDQPVVVRGSFIMNSDAQVIAAMDRYERGQMGQMQALTLE